MKHRQSGFTLIEMMIVVAILGIIAAIAYPSYENQVRKTRRSDGQAALLSLAQNMERCFSETNTYVGCAGGGVTPEGWYTVAITGATASTFTLTATPLLAQVNDLQCATMGISQTGAKTITGTGTVQDCW